MIEQEFLDRLLEQRAEIAALHDTEKSAIVKRMALGALRSHDKIIEQRREMVRLNPVREVGSDEIEFLNRFSGELKLLKDRVAFFRKIPNPLGIFDAAPDSPPAPGLTNDEPPTLPPGRK